MGSAGGGVGLGLEVDVGIAGGGDEGGQLGVGLDVRVGNLEKETSMQVWIDLCVIIRQTSQSTQQLELTIW